MSKRFLLSVLTAGSMLVGPLAQAQDITTVPPAAPAVAAPAVLAGPAGTGQIEDVQRMLAVMYADLENLKKSGDVGTSRILAVGSGAGAGYLLGGLLTAALLVPVVAPVATGTVAIVGLTEGVSAGTAATLETMGAFTGAYGGGLGADHLIE